MDDDETSLLWDLAESRSGIETQIATALGFGPLAGLNETQREDVEAEADQALRAWLLAEIDAVVPSEGYTALQLRLIAYREVEKRLLDLQNDWRASEDDR